MVLGQHDVLVKGVDILPGSLRKSSIAAIALSLLLTSQGAGQGLTIAMQPHVDLQGDPVPPCALARLGTVRLRHPSAVHKVIFSPDGRRLMSWGWGSGTNGQVYEFIVWDGATGKELQRFRDPWSGMQPHDVAFAPDGNALLTILGKRVRRLDLRTGRVTKEPSISDEGFEPPSYFHFTAGADRILARDYKKRVAMFDRSTGRVIVSMSDFSEPLCVALAHDGSCLAVACRDGSIRVRDASNGREIGRWQTESSYAAQLAFSIDGSRLVARTEKGMRVWSATTGQLIRQFPKDTWGGVFAPDGRTFAVADNGHIEIWDLDEGRKLRECTGRGAGPKFSPDGKQLAAACGYTVGLWEVATGRQVHCFPSHESGIGLLAFAPDGQSVVSGEWRDGKLLTWDVRTGRVRQQAPMPNFPHCRFSVSPNCSLVALAPPGVVGGRVANEPERVGVVLSLPDGKLVHRFRGHEKGVLALALSADGKWLATAGLSSTTKIWDMTTGKLACELPGEKDCPRALAFAPDGKTLIESGFEDMTSLWRLDAGKRTRAQKKLGFGWNFLQFLADGRTVLAADSGTTPNTSQVRFWDTASGQVSKVRELHQTPHGIDHLVSTSEGTLLIAVPNAEFPPRVQLWETATGKLVGEWYGHTGTIDALAVSPDSKMLATGSQDSTILLWDLTQARLDAWWCTLTLDSAEKEVFARCSSIPPTEMVTYLGKRLREAAALEARAGRLITELDDDKFQVRARAAKELRALGKDSVLPLRMALFGKPSAELRRQAEEIIQANAEPVWKFSPSEPGRVLASFGVLERIGSEAAREVLHDAARIAPDSRLGREATASLGRLKKRE